MNYGPYVPMQPYSYQPQVKDYNDLKDKVTQPVVKNFVELRVLNDSENVDTLYVQNKTLFINDKNMILKGIDGSLEKWEINKVYPVDPKDQKIMELEREIKELKEMIKNGPVTNTVEDTPKSSRKKSTDDE